MQKEQFTLLDENKQPSTFAPIMIATLSTCAQLERENIKFRLNSGRAQYIAKGGKLGRKVGSTKTKEQKKEEYKEVITLLKKGYSVRNTASLCKVSNSTVQYNVLKKISFYNCPLYLNRYLCKKILLWIDMKSYIVLMA